MTVTTDYEAPPQNLEAEESVLGALLLAGWHGVGEKTLPRVLAAGLEPGHFFRPSHGAIFAAMLSLTERNGSIDPLCVERELERQGALEAAGGTSRVRELAHSASATANAPHYARLVVDSAARREEFAIGKELHAAAMSGEDLRPELIARIRALIDRCDGTPRSVALQPLNLAEFLAGDPPETSDGEELPHAA